MINLRYDFEPKPGFIWQGQTMKEDQTRMCAHFTAAPVISRVPCGALAEVDTKIIPSSR